MEEEKLDLKNKEYLNFIVPLIVATISLLYAIYSHSFENIFSPYYYELIGYLFSFGYLYFYC